MCTVFDSILSNIDEVLSINPSANVFVFGDFNIHHMDWLTYSSWTDWPGELCYNFSISNDITWTVPIALLFRIYFFLLILVFVLEWFSFHWEILILLLSVSIEFPSKSQQDGPFHRIAYDYSRGDWDGLRDEQFKPHSSKISVQASLISMVFSLCCCHSSKKSLFSFVPKG